MVERLRPIIARHLPENVVYSLVLARHGETSWQLAARGAAARLRERTHGAGAQQLPARAPVPTTVQAFDAHEVQRANVAAVSRALDRCGVAYALVPESDGRRRHVAVSADDRTVALAAVARELDGPEWALGVPRLARGLGHLPTSEAARLRERGVVRVFRLLAAENGESVAGAELGCELGFWDEVDSSQRPRADGGTYTSGTRLAPGQARGLSVDYLSPTAWRAATSAAEHWPADALRETLFQVREPIDIVYTWVDGDDPQWLARKRAYGSVPHAGLLNGSADHRSRFSSRDELRYSLRSVSMYANWVRNIFVVTDRQVPEWLDIRHPRIQVVDHSQIFTDTSVLPVFNSHAIESQLHHVPGLAERYLYLNDDVFFGRPVTPELFFHGNGLAKFFLSQRALDIDAPSSGDLPVVSAAKRNRDLVEKRFGATVTHRFQHTPHPQLRSVNEQLEREYPEGIAEVARSRFRHPDDLSIASALHHYFAYGIGRAVPASLKYVYQDTARADTRRRLRNLLRTRDADVFCLNELETDPAHAHEQREMLLEFFERYFPVPSPFESTISAQSCDG